jgi:hypothetical protein
LAWRVLDRTLLGQVALIGFAENALTAIGSLAPISLVDGGIIYANLRKM